MRLPNFFKGKDRKKVPGKKRIRREKPSPEHIAFSEGAKNMIEETAEQFGFHFHRQEIERWFSTVIYRNGQRYIKVSASTHYREYPPFYYNIILGEGDSEDLSENTWNSVALWSLKLSLDPTVAATEYSFPSGHEIQPSLAHARDELLKFGITFLENDLTLFYETRKGQNKDRLPMQIHSPGPDGKHHTTFDPESERQKRNYS